METVTIDGIKHVVILRGKGYVWTQPIERRCPDCPYKPHPTYDEKP